MKRATINAGLRKPFAIAVVGILLTVLNEVIQWPILKLWNIYANNGFIDFASPLHHIECFSQGANIEMLRRETGVCSGYWYGEAWLQFGKFINLYQVKVYALVFPLIFVFYWWVAIQFKIAIAGKEMTARILIATLLLSPPLILLIQRGNLDLLMFLLLISGVSLIKSKKESHIFMAFLVLAFAVLMKFWALPALIVVILRMKNNLLRIISLLLSLSITVRVISEYKQVNFGQALESNINVFGFKFLSAKIDSTTTFAMDNSKSLIMDLSFFLLEKLYDPILAIFGSCYVFCYFMSMNVDYRLLLLMIFVLRLVSKINSKELINIILLLGNATVWLTYPSGQLQIVGDFMACLFCATILLLFAHEQVNKGLQKLSGSKTMFQKNFTR
jgi:hypothetical protein